MLGMNTTDRINLEREAYLDNSGYDVNDSLEECKRYIRACRNLLMLLPKRAAKDTEEFELNPASIQDELKEAVAWRQRYGNNSPDRIKFIALENRRGA